MKKNQNIKKAKLFVCASCEWFFKNINDGCPKCHFAYYSAHYVYGKQAYRLAKTQERWIEKKISSYHYALRNEVDDTSDIINNAGELIINGIKK